MDLNWVTARSTPGFRLPQTDLPYVCMYVWEGCKLDLQGGDARGSEWGGLDRVDTYLEDTNHLHVFSDPKSVA